MAANLKEVRERISSVKNTEQITKAMKMVSASKLRRAQQAISQMRPYAEKLNAMLRNILSNLEGDAETTFGVERPVERVAVVVITSNRGLAGAFNSNISKAARVLIETAYAEHLAKGTLDLICIGRKGLEYFTKRFPDTTTIIDKHTFLFNDLSSDNIGAVAQELMDSFKTGQYDVVQVVYSNFKNAATQIPTVEQFLPVAKLESEDVINEDSKERSKGKANYIFEPGQAELLEYLVPSILKNQFQKFVLDTHASEHGARMTAMDKASENAKELLKDLRISYNKARQEAITTEILEIVSGAAALESGG